MIVRDDLVKSLKRKLDGRLSEAEIDALAKEITGLQGDWEEINIDPQEMGYTMSVDCSDICALAEAIAKGREIRFFMRKEPG